MAEANVRNNQGGPFGAIVVLNGEVVGRGVNRVTETNDPTAHAEVVAIRDACQKVGHFRLDQCTIYSSCEPCPMCLGAIYWARIGRLVFAASNTDAAKAGFDDSYIYKQIPLPLEQRGIPTAKLDIPTFFQPFQAWLEMEEKTEY